MADDPVFTAVLDSLLDCLAFFELCDDETLDPRVAVRQLGEVTLRFDQLDAAERVRLAEVIAARAESFQPPVRQFVEEAPEALGLLDDDE